MLKKRVHILVFGLVQGVFFRHTTKAWAEKLGLRGWVRNTDDEKVEIVAEGDEEKLKELISWCHEGPTLAQVDKVEIEWENPRDEFDSFEMIS